MNPFIPMKYPCPNKCGAIVPYGQEHNCNPSRDRDEAPENRPELHYRKDLMLTQGHRYGTDKTEKQEIPEQRVTKNTGGAATVGTLLPNTEPEHERNDMEKSVEQYKSKVARQEEIYPDTEARYENPADVRRMDATEDYPHAYREEGYRYGSPCSYDDHDDESKP
jgi:hypothetical protein